MAYTTQAKVEEALNRTLTASEVSYLTTLLPAIDKYINNETETSFGESATVTVFVGGEGSDLLITPTLNNVTEVKYEGVVIPSSEYTTSPRGKDFVYALHSKNGWSEGFENYSITAKHGFPEVPADITAAATEIAVNYFTGQQAATSGAKSEKVGDWSITYLNGEQAVSERTRAALRNYRRLSRSI